MSASGTLRTLAIGVLTSASDPKRTSAKTGFVANCRSSQGEQAAMAEVFLVNAGDTSMHAGTSDPLFKQNLEDAAQRWTQIAPELAANTELLDNCQQRSKSAAPRK